MFLKSLKISTVSSTSNFDEEISHSTNVVHITIPKAIIIRVNCMDISIISAGIFFLSDPVMVVLHFQFY